MPSSTPLFLRWFVLLRGEKYIAAAKLLQSCPTLCDPIDGSHQTPPSLGFSRQEYWSGLPFPSPMHESEKWKWSCSVVSDSSLLSFFFQYLFNVVPLVSWSPQFLKRSQYYLQIIVLLFVMCLFFPMAAFKMLPFLWISTIWPWYASHSLYLS